MNAALARRELALAGIAIVAAVIALGSGAIDRSDDGASSSAARSSVPAPGADWYQALAAPYPVTTRKKRTTCGHELGADTMGVAHPVLPCGVKIFIEFDDERVLTQVIDRGPAVPGREFDVTRPLAEKLGLEGTQRIRWRYAR